MRMRFCNLRAAKKCRSMAGCSGKGCALLFDEQHAERAGAAVAGDGAAGAGDADLLEGLKLADGLFGKRLDLRADAGMCDEHRP